MDVDVLTHPDLLFQQFLDWNPVDLMRHGEFSLKTRVRC